jgi:hypothetical protein
VGNGPFDMNKVGRLGIFWRQDPDMILGFGKIVAFI